MEVRTHLGQIGNASGDEEAGDFHCVSGSQGARTVKEVPFGGKTGDSQTVTTGEEDMPPKDDEDDPKVVVKILLDLPEKEKGPRERRPGEVVEPNPPQREPKRGSGEESAE